MELLVEYLVRDHQGRPYSGEGSIQDFIKAWLTPDPVPIGKGLLAIIEGLRFREEPGDLREVYNTLGINGVGQQFLLDLQNYPLTRYFGDPLRLINSFVQAPDRGQYVYSITGVPPEHFLNYVEMLFFLTHGYGRPNIYIGERDMRLRQIYKRASGTALIALSDIFDLCPGKQDPRPVRENLSTINLETIDTKHQKIVQAVTEKGSDPEALSQLLISIGMLPIHYYDPITKVYKTNLSQLGLYDTVQPNLKWEPDSSKVLDLPDLDIYLYLQTLPDLELLKIFRSSLDSINNRLRSVLLQRAYQFLTLKRYTLEGEDIVYGRVIDSRIDKWPLSIFLKFIEQYKILIDPKLRFFSLENALVLNEQLQSHVLEVAIKRVQELESINYFQLIPPDVRYKFVYECQTLLKYSPNQEDMQDFILQQPSIIQSLPIMKFRSTDDWFITGATLQQFAQEDLPISIEDVTDSLHYYILTLVQ